jgi:hypothetical protein
MKKVLIALVMLLTMALTASATKFDVKTRLTRKGGDVTVFKATIIKFLELKGHKIKEIGEDYSIFIDDFQVLPEGNKVRVIISGEIGQPSLFGKGKTIAKITIDKVYDTKKISDPKKWTVEDRAKFEELGESSEKSLGKGKLLVGIAEMAGNIGNGVVGSAIRGTLDFLGVKIDDNMNNHIVLGAFLGGTDVVKDIETFLK